MTRALEAPDPMLADPPMHPSYEDRAGAPDRIFASLDDAEYERQVVAWCRALQAAGAADADVLHLHHLTPIHEAAARVAPGVPVVGHLHGTELLMLEAIEADPAGWAHAAAWAERLRGWAAACERVIVLSETAVKRAERPARRGPRPLRAGPERVRPGGVPSAGRSTTRRTGGAISWRSRRAGRRASPRGRSRYSEADLAAFADDDGETPVLLYVGPLHRGQAAAAADRGLRARPARASRRRAPLVIVGGFPGEWEGEHPLETIRRVGARGRVPGRLARPRRAARVPRRLRRRGAALGARAVRPGAGRGDGVRPAGDRGRRLRARPTSSTTARPAGWSSPTTASRSPTRSSTRSTARASGRGAGKRAAADAMARYSWPALAARGGRGLRVGRCAAAGLDCGWVRGSPHPPYLRS